MVGLFVAALFASATLLFWVQPMVARMLLPLLGGTPTVWNTCMIFFQALLLAGYAYAHFLANRFSLRTQTLIHLALMLITFFVALPISLAADATRAAPWNSNPSLWLLGTLLVVVGLPFFTLSASAPLLQSWFNRAGHRSSADPYFLYTASNAGSLIGLLGYPALIEPGFRLAAQTHLWSAGYVLLVVIFAGCAVVLWRRRGGGGSAPVEAAGSSTPKSGGPSDDVVNWPRRFSWILWAFIPSSLMLGVTTFLTTDIASVPLLWVIPLGIYLLTFILVFARRRVVPAGLIARILPGAAVVLVFVILMHADNLAWLQIVLHLGFFFLAAMVWHGRLADDRPSGRRLTEFYFCLSAGGVLGGVFNALVAPMVFRTVAEYPIAIALACLQWPGRGKGWFESRPWWRELVWPLAIGLLTAVLAMLASGWDLGLQARGMIVFGVPVILCYVASKQPRPLVFALALGAVFVGSRFYTAFHGRTLHAERNFFGTLRMSVDPDGRMFRLYHGTTVHGMEFIAPERQGEPLAYYHRRGPCGQAMDAFNALPHATNVAAIGLGAGSMIAYARPGQQWTFYEINPAVIRLARDTNYFTFLDRNTNAAVDFKLGDARLRLREAPPHQFNLLVCDAFGSDAPPLHLLNREAMELYLSKLAPDGLLLLHISSRFLNFRPVIGNLAEHFNLEAWINTDDEITEEMMRDGRLPASWVALARRPEDLGRLRDDPRWHRLPPAPGRRLWTDDYSNILSIFDWE